MKPYLRLSIASALVGIALFALAFAALKSSNLLWTQVTFTLACATLLWVLVGAMVGDNRAVWVGAAIFGWGYATLVFAPWFCQYVRPWLLTARIIHESFFLLHPDPLRNTGDGTELLSLATWVPLGEIGLGNARPESRYVLFSRIAESLSVIVHTVQGAIFGWLFCFMRRGNRLQASPNPEVTRVISHTDRQQS